MTVVKICGITNAADGVQAAEAGASAVGFNFFPGSPRYIEPPAAAAIARELPATVWKAGIFVNAAVCEIERAADEVGLDIAQLYGGETPGTVRFRVWRASSITEFQPRMADGVEAVLVDTPSELLGGTGRAFDWTLARNLGVRVVLAGGLDAGNVRAAIEAARPWGVDACSRLESAPGRKDHAKVRDFIQAALNL